MPDLWAAGAATRTVGGMSPPASTERPEVDRRSRRRWALLGAAVVLTAGGAIGLALFQPWKLWVDDKVDQAAPAGAVPITAPAVPAPTVPPNATAATTLPDTSVAPTTSPATAVPATAAPPTAPPTTVASVPVGGDFVGIDHGTTGRVVLLQDENGAQFVRLENLDTTNGPDLFVYLSTNAPAGPEGQFDDDYVNLGRLAGNIGSSNYAIPSGTDLSRYASVVIWCDRFNSAFGAAPLS